MFAWEAPFAAFSAQIWPSAPSAGQPPARTHRLSARPDHGGGRANARFGSKAVIRSLAVSVAFRAYGPQHQDGEHAIFVTFAMCAWRRKRQIGRRNADRNLSA